MTPRGEFAIHTHRLVGECDRHHPVAISAKRSHGVTPFLVKYRLINLCPETDLDGLSSGESMCGQSVMSVPHDNAILALDGGDRRHRRAVFQVVGVSLDLIL